MGRDRPAADPGTLHDVAQANPRRQIIPGSEQPGGESTMTVLIAFGANFLIAVAKTFAAMLTASASLAAEAAHSWADTGNEVFLLIAGRRSRRPADESHPLGYGRESYVWSMFAAMGLFVAGAVLSISEGVSGLLNPEEATDFVVGYIVLAGALVVEGVSLVQSLRQARGEARELSRDVIDHVLITSDPTLRAVVFEDSAAITGVVIAAAALGIHEWTGSSVPDAVGSILIGLLLGVGAVVLINRNRRFLIGEMAEPPIRAAVLTQLQADPGVDRVTYLRVDFVGPRMVFVIGDVDLAGDAIEHDVAERLRAVEDRLRESSAVVDAVLSLSAADEPSLPPPEQDR
jgi:cation diffusion facilitator family transporter